MLVSGSTRNESESLSSSVSLCKLTTSTTPIHPGITSSSARRDYPQPTSAPLFSPFSCVAAAEVSLTEAQTAPECPRAAASMPATKTHHYSALSSLSKSEMDDRKRSLVADVEDLAPSRKRLKDENGSVMRMDEQKERDVEVRSLSH